MIQNRYPLADLIGIVIHFSSNFGRYLDSIYREIKDSMLIEAKPLQVGLQKGDIEASFLALGDEKGILSVNPSRRFFS